MRTRLLFYIIPVILLNSCVINKDDYYYVDESIKPWALFQPGTYWIYENDSGRIDSTIVLSVDERWTEEETEVSVFSINRKYVNTQWFYVQMERFLCDSEYPCVDTIVDFYRVVSNKTWFVWYNVLSKVNYYPVFTLNGIEFKDVVRVKDIWSESDLYFYYARSYGVIMQVEYSNSLTDSTTWKILRYNIVQ